MALKPLSFEGMWEVGLAAVANAFAGTVRTTVFNVSQYKQTTFLLHKAVGATGTSTITVEGSDDTSPSNVSAVAFWYRKSTTLDTWGAWTAATSAGFTTTAGSNQLYEIAVDNDVLGVLGYKYISLKAVEVAASAVLGGVLVHLGLPRFPGQTQQQSALT